MQQPAVAPEGYEILRELGRGGMGIVYEARQVRLDRRVALKVMIAGREGSPELLHRFVQEARSAARLQHPNIVQVLEAGVEGSLHYFTMDVLDGTPVSSLVRPDPLPPSKAATIARQVALALDYAHAQGVLHRDVKPSNILVDAVGEPHIVDFGLAKILQVPGTTVQGIGLGTPAYASPEQLNGELDRVGPRSDVYSVGATLFEMLTGRPPFNGENDFEVFVSVLRTPPDSPRRWVPTLPTDLETICLKCLEKEPERRYPSARALADDLGRFLAGEPIQARPVSHIGRFASQIRRRPGVAAAAVAAVLAVVSVGGWFAWRSADRDRRLALGLEQAAAAERRGAWAEARDALLGVLDVDPGRADARAALDRVDGAIASVARERQEDAERAKREAAAAEELVRKSQLVSTVLSRWARMQDAVLAIERATHSFKLTDEQIDAEVERNWPAVLAFVRETPGDPTSQAAMRAFYAWALFLDGREEEALTEARAAQGLDPDVPYGSFVEAMFVSDDYLIKAAMSRLRAGLPTPGAPRPPSSPEVEAIEKEVRTLLDHGAGARVWGPEGAEDFRAAFQGIDAAVCGDPAAAEAPLCRAIESPDLKTFRIRFLFLRALARGQREEYEGAMRDLDEVEAAWPGDESVEGVRAAIRTLKLARIGKGGTIDPRDMKDLGEMLELVKDAPELAANVEMQGHMAILSAALAAEQGKDTRKQFRDGIAALTQALGKAPKNTMARLSRATGWVGLGRLQERMDEAAGESYTAAIADFDLLLAADPKSFPARQGRAAAREELGDAKGAIEDYRALAQIEPKNVGAWERIAALSRSIGDHAAAEESLARVLAMDPRHGSAKRTRGLVRVERRDWKGAIEDLDAVIGANAEDFEALEGRAAAWKALGDEEKARADLDAAARGREAEAKRRCERSAERLGKGDLGGALADASKAIELSPGSAEAHVRRAAVLNARQDWVGAIADADAALKIDPEAALAYQIRASARKSKGDLTGAIVDYDELLRRDRGNAAAWHNRGRTWHEARDLDRAIADYGEAIRRNPRFVEAWANLGRARMEKGDADAARSYFTTCLELAPADWPHRKAVEGWLAELGEGK